MNPFSFPAPNGATLNRLTAQQRAEAIKQSYETGKRVKAFQLTTGVGNNSFNLQLSGQGQWLLGLAFIGGTANSIVQFTINNDVMVESTPMSGLAINPAAQGRDFYEFSRGLNGNDQFKLDVVQTVASQNFSILLYYI